MKHTKVILTLFATLFLCAAGAKASVYSLNLSSGTGVTITSNGTTALYNNFVTGAGSGIYTRMFAIQNNGTEMGYNADTGSHPFDQKSGVGTPQQDLGGMPIVIVGGVAYVQILLDVQESDAAVTLTEFRAYVTPDPSNTNTLILTSSEASTQYNVGTSGTLGKLVYSLDDTPLGNNNDLSMTNESGGSGTSDLEILIPVSVYAGFANNDNVYFWAKFTGASSTAEEFATFKGATLTYGSLTPEPATALGGGMVAAMLFGAHFRRSRRKAVPAC